MPLFLKILRHLYHTSLNIPYLCSIQKAAAVALATGAARVVALTGSAKAAAVALATGAARAVALTGSAKAAAVATGAARAGA